MGVYINGMEMPKACIFCELYDHDNYWCHAAEKDVEPCFDEKLCSFCPLVPVPPHGDLIERDKLREKEFIHDGDAYAVVMSRDIRNAPIIIPAEKER